LAAVPPLVRRGGGRCGLGGGGQQRQSRNHAEGEGLAGSGLFQRADDKGEKLLLQQLSPP